MGMYVSGCLWSDLLVSRIGGLRGRKLEVLLTGGTSRSRPTARETVGSGGAMKGLLVCMPVEKGGVCLHE